MEMKRRRLMKMAMASRMKTSRAALDRLLDPNNPSVTIGTLEKADGLEIVWPSEAGGEVDPTAVRGQTFDRVVVGSLQDMSGNRKGLLLGRSFCRAITIKGVAMIESPLLDELRERLVGAFGDRLHSVVLFGSEARGEAGAESDIDLLVVLDHVSADYGDELERGLTAVYPVALRLGRRVSVKPLDLGEYERGDSPLLREVRRTGVAA